jgi:ABC-type antimicrobial peptide transport system permease subunit
LIVPAVRQAIADVDADLEIRGVETLDRTVAATLRRERMLATSLSAFAAVTMLLTAVGLYATMAYGAARRRAEISIRRALGATDRRVVAWMLTETAMVIAMGTAVGVPVAAATLGTLRTLLFNITPLDALAFGAAFVVVLGVGLAAAALPVLEAIRVSPATALRCE